MAQTSYESYVNTLWNDRFFELRILEDGTKRLWPTTADNINKTYNFAYLSDEPEMILEYFWNAPDGTLHRVSINECHDMVADNKIVGHINYPANVEI